MKNKLCSKITEITENKLLSNRRIYSILKKFRKKD